MPQYQAPGVFVEETSFRARAITGVTTSTAAFVGPTRRGPVDVLPEALSSLSDFERIYGGSEDLEFAVDDVDAPCLNFMAHSVRAFFENGGTRLYVARTLRHAAFADGPLRAASVAADRIRIRARFAGASYNGRVSLREVGAPATGSVLRAAPSGSLLSITDAMGVETLYVGSGDTWAEPTGVPLPLDGLGAAEMPGGEGVSARLITLTVEASDFDDTPLMWSRLGLAPAHPRWLGTVLGEHPPGPTNHYNPLWADIGGAVDAFSLLAAVRALPPADGDAGDRRALTLAGGHDGQPPEAGGDDTPGSYIRALGLLRELDDVSTVAAPGSSAGPDGAAILRALVTHAERPRAYCMALLDGAPGQSPDAVRALRAAIDSSRAALYYPWIVVACGPEAARPEIALPPSGFLAGIYARSDVARGVHKAPANEVVTGALRFERDLRVGDLEMLSPIGVNCLRELPGRGRRVWGARTAASSEPEWIYVPARRYMNYLAASIDRGTQWIVFEPNNERLWATVRRVVSDFLGNEWRSGALLGTKPEDAFFVRCDRSTMTQNDLDNGRLVVLIGVATNRPAEFVIFRVAQQTADSAAS